MILFHIFIFSKYVYLLPFNFTFPNLFIIFICLYSLSFSAQIKTDSPFPVLSVFGDPGVCCPTATYLTIHPPDIHDKKGDLKSHLTAKYPNPALMRIHMFRCLVLIRIFLSASFSYSAKD